jgi:uncharacterized protein
MTANDEPESPRRVTHGQLTYLQIPAVDLLQSAAFYESVFGWRVERPYPSFEAPGLIGQWVTERPVGAGAGMLAWIAVDDMDTSLDLVRANGGDVLKPPSADGPSRLLATVSDPGGNAVGIVMHVAR